MVELDPLKQSTIGRSTYSTQIGSIVSRCKTAHVGKCVKRRKQEDVDLKVLPGARRFISVERCRMVDGRGKLTL